MGAHRHGLSDFLIHNDVDLYSLLGFALQHPVQPPFRIISGRATKVQLWSEPPILHTAKCERGLAITVNRALRE